MNNNTGGAAFPHHIEHPNGHWPVITHAGMTLRDYFAAKAMEGLLSGELKNTNTGVIAHDCYAMADAMLKAREDNK